MRDLEKKRAWDREHWTAERQERRRQRRKRPDTKAKERAYARVYIAVFRAKHPETKEQGAMQSRRLHQKYWEFVFAHYGDRCAICGITDKSILAIDHVNGGGALQRKSQKNIHGHKLAKWLRDNGFPEGYRILCHNCNWKEYLRSRGKTSGTSSRRSLQDNRKASVYAAYGNKCAMCGETDQDVLSVDHVDGNGHSHVATVKGGWGGLYKHILDTGCPPDYQILCRNCNYAKGHSENKS